MTKHLYSICLLLLVGMICFSGCTTTTRTSLSNKQNMGNLSIQVTLNQDGTFTYIGDIVDRDDLPRILKKAGASVGRSVTIKAADNVEKKALVEARQFLVYKGFPNVTIITPRIAVSYEEELKPNNQ